MFFIESWWCGGVSGPQAGRTPCVRGRHYPLLRRGIVPHGTTRDSGVGRSDFAALRRRGRFMQLPSTKASGSSRASAQATHSRNAADSLRGVPTTGSARRRDRSSDASGRSRERSNCDRSNHVYFFSVDGAGEAAPLAASSFAFHSAALSPWPFPGSAVSHAA